MRLFEGGSHIIGGCLFCVTMVAIVTWATKNEVTDNNDNNSPLLLAHNETLEVMAIKELHTQIDDNKDGQVDYKESTEFVREEIAPNSLSGDRSSKLHLKDDRISLDELWTKWKDSTVYNWSNEDVIEWLVGVVDLPELVPRFRELGVSGKQLPLIATNSDQLLSQLDVKGKQKRRKLQLKAMDIVLFGPLTIPHSYWKDIVMSFSVLFCVVGLTYAWRKHHSANKSIDKFFREMKIYETELKHLREKFREETDNGESQNNEEINKSAKLTENSAESASTSSESSLDSDKTALSKSATLLPDHTHSTLSGAAGLELTQQTEALQTRVWSLENQLETLTTNKLALRELLQETCLREKKYLDMNKKTAEDEVISAQKMCDKIKRKRTTVIGAFRLANSSALEDAGLLITRAVNKMQKVTNHFDDYHKRWKSIEQSAGFPILNPALTSSAHFDSDESLPDSPRATRSGSIKSMRSRSLSISSGYENMDAIFMSLPPHPRPSSDKTNVTGQSQSVNESEIRTSSEWVESIPSWYSAPNNLYRKMSYSELEFINEEGCGQEGMISTEDSDKYNKESHDSLGVIEEEEKGLAFSREGPEKGSTKGLETNFKDVERSSRPRLKRTKSRNNSFN